MQMVEIGGKSFSKIVCGTNAFYGRSHFSDARDVEYRMRCHDDYIRQVIECCLQHGVNTIETSANERIQQLVRSLREQHAMPIYLIGNTRIDQTSTMNNHQQKFKFLLEHRADIVVIHSQFVDRPRKSDDINGLSRLVQQIHDAGLIAGISTHRNATVELCEEKNYGIDVYLFPLNPTGFVYPGYEGNETPDERIRLIQNTPKPFVLMKTLGAGRIPPREGLEFALEHAKSNDIITLGLSSIEEAEESLAIVQAALNPIN